MENLKKQLQTNKVVKIIEILSVFLVAFIIIQLFLKPEGEHLLYNQGVVWVANVVMLIMVWLGLRLRGQTFQAFGLTFGKTSFKAAMKAFLLSLVVFVLALLGFAIGSIIMANITGIPEGANMSSYAYLKDNLGMLFLTLAGVYVVSSFGEEVIYRGFLINRITELGLSGRRGEIIAAIISAFIFGFAHYSWGPMGIAQTTFMGLALGLCYIFMQKRLWILVLAHAYMDTILMVQLYLASN